MAPSNERIHRLREEMTRSGVDVVAIAPGSNLRYFLGMDLHYDERPCALLVSDRHLLLVIPSLNADQAEAQAATVPELQLFRWTDDEGPATAIDAAARLLGRAPVLALDSILRADTLIPFRNRLEPERLTLALDMIRTLRMRKTDDELALIQAAATQADRALAAGMSACRSGATESEIAGTIDAAFRRDGAEAVDFVIVASGPHSAFPHHRTGNRSLAAGDPVILDIGATLDGYKSDVTRMVYLGEPPVDFLGVYDAVRIANDRARTAARPGVPARVVDEAARGALRELRLAEYFVHRTGHGLGLDVHEPPYITATSETVLEPGMVFSVEPGAYMPGKFGVRIEDIIVVTPDGSRTLTGSSHDLVVR